MEMEMEVVHADAGLDGPAWAPIERLLAAAVQLERLAERIAEREVELQASAARGSGLEERLAAAEGMIAALKAGRKTSAAGLPTLLAKDGGSVEAGSLGAGSLGAGSLDAALGSLSIEQRIAVKAGLLRSGLLG